MDICLLICLLIFAACDSENGNPMDENTSASGESSCVAVSVTTTLQEFTDAQTGTRAVENGTALTFGSGDAIGVFAVKIDDGTIKPDCKNIRLEYVSEQAGRVSWKGTDNIYYFDEDTEYYAYFPYSSDYDNVSRFFEVEDDFDRLAGVNFDQSTQQNYMKCCQLLKSSGQSLGDKNTKSLSFTFIHALSMIEIIIPEQLKGYSNANSENFTYNIYGTPTPTAWKINDQESTFFKVADRTYRRVVTYSAGMKIQAVLNNTFTFTKSSLAVKVGDYKRITLDKINYDLRVGDFAYGGNGGTLAFFPGSTIVAAPDAANCIGVVTYMGNVGGYLDSRSHKRGAVIAKTYYSKQANYNQASDNPGNYTPQAPANTSGWYFPLNEEMRYYCSGLTVDKWNATELKKKIDPYLSMAGGEMWGNSEVWADRLGSKYTYINFQNGLINFYDYMILELFARYSFAF